MFSHCGLLVVIAGLVSTGLAQEQYARRQGRLLRRQHQPLPVEVLKEEEVIRPKVYEVQHQISPNVGDGSFRYFSATSDGHQSEQQGYFNHPLDSQVHQGSYTTNDEFGKVVRVDYIADKDGFRPIGANGAAILPTPPPVPLEQIKAREDILRQQEVIRQQHLGYHRGAHVKAYTAHAQAYAEEAKKQQLLQSTPDILY